MPEEREFIFLGIKDYFLNVHNITRASFDEDSVLITFDNDNVIKFGTSGSPVRVISSESLADLKGFFKNNSYMTIHQ